MKEYKIEIKETLQRTIKINAKSKEEAIRKAKEKYRNSEIILGAEDFKNVDFK